MAKLRAVCVGLALGALLTLASAPVGASPLFELVGDSQGMGGQQARTVPGGAAAAYFNPALLTEAPAGTNVGMMVLAQRIGVSLQPRPGLQYDVPANVQNATGRDFSFFDDYPIPTGQLQIGKRGDGVNAAIPARPRQGAGTGKQNYTYITFGLLVKLFKDRLALAMTGLLPLKSFTTLQAFYSDEREQYYSNSLHSELYGDRLTAPSIAFAVGIKVLDNLSVGAGATLDIAAPAQAQTHVTDVNRLDRLTLDLNAPVKVSLTPHFGVTGTLFKKRLRLSSAVHPPSRLDVKPSFSFLIGSNAEQSSSLSFTTFYMPWRVSAGAAFDILRGPKRNLSIAATLLYARWSTYVDRHSERPLPAYSWYDTLSPTVGVRHSQGGFSSLLDLSYAPSPVPMQTGRSNYVDNNRMTVAAGSEYGFSLFGARMQLGLQAQIHSLIRRYQYKLPTPTNASGENLTPQLVKDELPDDSILMGRPVAGARGLQTNNPGWPGFGSRGLIFVGALTLRAEF